MKKKPAILFGLLIAVIIGGAAVYGKSAVDYFQVKTLTNTYFEEVSEQDFNQAFDYVGYHTEASDLEVRIAEENAREKWVRRITDTSNNGLFVTKLQGLSLSFHDTFPTATAIIFYEENGEFQETIATTTYVKREEWKIAHIMFWDETPDSEHPLAMALSGYLGEK